MSDPDASYTDFGLSLFASGKSYNLKNDGKFTMLNIPGNTLCPRDSIRLKSGTIVLTLMQNAVQVSAQCMRGQYIPLCQSYSWVDYPFSVTHSWAREDTVIFTTGTNQLRLCNGSPVSVGAQAGFSGADGCRILCRSAGRSLLFVVTPGSAKKLDRIGLYDVKGQLLALLHVDGRTSVAAPVSAGFPGIVFVKYFFSDGSSSGRNMVLVR